MNHFQDKIYTRLSDTGAKFFQFFTFLTFINVKSEGSTKSCGSQPTRIFGIQSCGTPFQGTLSLIILCLFLFQHRIWLKQRSQMEHKLTYQSLLICHITSYYSFMLLVMVDNGKGGIGSPKFSHGHWMVNTMTFRFDQIN